jgi:hypothetical protein
MIYETDTDKVLQYTTATTGWVPPWNMPWGVVGKALGSSNQTGITTATAVTSLSVTWTAVASRVYKTSVYLPVVDQVTTNAQQIFTIDKGEGTRVQQLNQMVLAGNRLAVSMLLYETGLAAGSTTRRVTASTQAGTLAITAASDIPNVLIVEDIGPNGSPA